MSMCPPLAADLLLIPSTSPLSDHDTYGMNSAVWKQVGNPHLGHFYSGNPQRDQFLTPLAEGTDILGDLVHMGASRGFRLILLLLQNPQAQIWADLSTLMGVNPTDAYGPRHSVANVFSWCRFLLALLVYGPENYRMLVGEQDGLCLDFYYPPAPTSLDAKVFYHFAQYVISQNEVDYLEFHQGLPPGTVSIRPWEFNQDRNWRFRLLCNALPAIDRVMTHYFPSPRQQFFLPIAIPVAVGDLPFWKEEGYLELREWTPWKLQEQFRPYLELDSRMPSFVDSNPTPSGNSPQIRFWLPPLIIQERDYALARLRGEPEKAAPTWPYTRSLLCETLAVTRQPYDPDILLVDGGFFEAQQAERALRAEQPDYTPDPRALRFNSRLFATEQLYQRTMEEWTRVVGACQQLLLQNPPAEAITQTSLDKLFQEIERLRSLIPVLPPIVETVKLIEIIQLACARWGRPEDYPTWRKWYFGSTALVEGEDHCGMCHRPLTTGVALFASAGACPHRFHMTCVLPLLEVVPSGLPHCPVPHCGVVMKMEDPDKYQKFFLFPTVRMEDRMVDVSKLPKVVPSSQTSAYPEEIQAMLGLQMVETPPSIAAPPPLGPETPMEVGEPPDRPASVFSEALELHPAPDERLEETFSEAGTIPTPSAASFLPGDLYSGRFSEDLRDTRDRIPALIGKDVGMSLSDSALDPLRRVVEQKTSPFCH